MVSDRAALSLLIGAAFAAVGSNACLPSARPAVAPDDAPSEEGVFISPPNTVASSVAIDELAAEPWRYDGRRVAVEGFTEYPGDHCCAIYASSSRRYPQDQMIFAELPISLVGLELQVRFVEEPYLLRTHATYASYASRVGRFLPGLGRLRGMLATTSAGGHS